MEFTQDELYQVAVTHLSSGRPLVALAQELGWSFSTLRNRLRKNPNWKGVYGRATRDEVKALAEKARNGKLAPHEFQGGTFSISNLGMYPVDQFCAIINPPQACILAVGKGERTVVWNEIAPGFGQPTCITRISVTISADNRVLDADVAGRFMQSLLANLSNPQSMLL